MPSGETLSEVQSTCTNLCSPKGNGSTASSMKKATNHLVHPNAHRVNAWVTKTRNAISIPKRASKGPATPPTQNKTQNNKNINGRRNSPFHIFDMFSKSPSPMVCEIPKFITSATTDKANPVPEI